MLYRVFFIICFIALTSVTSYAQTSKREYALKAGLIYNFARFSQRIKPIDSDIPLYVICSTSADFSLIAQKTLDKKLVQQRNVVVKFSTIENLKSHRCDIIYFNKNKQQKKYLLQQKNALSSAMLIGESPNFIALGGHINFIQVSGKIRFEINPEQLHASGIKVSSKVIRLGKIRKVDNS